MEELTFPCEQDGVKQLLPHRNPFLWVTRIVECVPGSSIVAELDVDPNLDIFKGHFPEYPVLPGVILMEALAQAASCCLLAQGDKAGSIGFLTGIDKAKFREQVRPGDTVRLEAEITRNSSRMCVAEVKAFKGEKLCAQATQKYVMAKQ
jgi:3-hydroxyacyl-[acyl-carrier-protein] dehydratase